MKLLQNGVLWGISASLQLSFYQRLLCLGNAKRHSCSTSFWSWVTLLHGRQWLRYRSTVWSGRQIRSWYGAIVEHRSWSCVQTLLKSSNVNEAWLLLWIVQMWLMLILSSIFWPIYRLRYQFLELRCVQVRSTYHYCLINFCSIFQKWGMSHRS